jgi:hypothetical protein
VPGGRSTISQGPFWARPRNTVFPPGTYDVTAVQNGATRTAKGVKIVKGKQRTIILVWKVAEVDMGL